MITGNLGPRAMDVLKQFNVDAFHGEGKVKDALDKFLEGTLKTIG